MGTRDRMPWTASTTIMRFGVRIGVRANMPELLALLTSRFPPGPGAQGSIAVERLYSAIASNHVESSNAVCGHNLLFCNGRKLASTTRWEDLRDSFESDLDFYVARTTRNWLFLHAGVVALDGQAIVLPGKSYSGKTTLVKALLDAGATYYSDEYAVLDRRGRVHPFPRPLSVRTNGGTRKIAAEQLGAEIGRGPLPIGLVILTRYKPSAHWWPNVWSPGSGVLGLLQNALAARLYPKLAIDILKQVVGRARVLGGVRGEAAETARSIMRNLDWAPAQQSARCPVSR